MAHDDGRNTAEGVRTFTVVVEETVTQEFQVEGSGAESAAEVARELYRAGDLVLSPGELQSARLHVTTDGELGIWEDL